ncbi:activating transcription factor 7-interacting protein 2 isoform X2 [Scleropages formosus]|uniref:activating transcription factor 7-interacting protein 2 isoform X2 n=1 Tax=Scleropages formosus TaxID=113540 RepID=UPI0010FAAAC0|nr:activating transcription factor 7-interacting protein 2 isoform X2 [Scleropages formosus]
MVVIPRKEGWVDSVVGTSNRYNIQELVRQAILATVKQSDQKMDELIRRIQKMESISNYEGRLLKLQASIKKIKKRGQAALIYMQDLRLSGTQTSPAGSIQTLNGTPSLEPLVVESFPTSPTKAVQTGFVADRSRSTDSPPLVTSTSQTLPTNQQHEVQQENESEILFCGVLLPKKRNVDGFCEKRLKKNPVVDLTSEGNAERDTLGRTGSLLAQNEGMDRMQTPVPLRNVCETEQSGVLVSMNANSQVAAQGKEVSAPHRVGSGYAPAQSAKDDWNCKVPPLPTPLFPAKLPAVAATKNLPQQLELKVAQIMNPKGIGLLWTVDKVDPNTAPLDSYHLYISQDNGLSSFSEWKNLGVLKALPLPMACRLSNCTPGQRCCFSIVARDIYGRFGPYSKVKSVTPNL